MMQAIITPLAANSGALQGRTVQVVTALPGIGKASDSSGWL
jgi:hypothetical protein